uniref:Uncharacterized protein n=1 Tax=mine drainage metagenome TaxID=410659 RepID=E6QRH5_9ZZZZ
MCGTSSFAVAAPEEIQVYMDEMDAPGQYGLDLHTNTVPSGNDAGTYPGVLPSAHLFRFTPEFSYGLTPNLELGAYVLSTDNATTGAQVDGGKVRIKFIAPKTTDQIYFWGANFEIGKVSAQLDPNPWNAELKGIFGLRYSGWTFAVNSNLDWVVSGPVPAPTTVEWDTKLAYAVTHVTQLGFESYNGLGVANNLGNLNQYSQMLYGVIDTSMDKWDLNLGIGRGLNAVSDQWVLKAIIGVPID